MKRGWMLLLILVAVLGFSGAASATLTTIGTATYLGNGYNLINEDDQGLIWLDYTNGRNIWDSQMSWAAGLNAPGVLTYKFNPGVSVSWGGDWRLPAAGEMGHLYYSSLGKNPGGPLGDPYPFTNLQASWYWSGTLSLYPEYGYLIEFFKFNNGDQLPAPDGWGDLYALAVRPEEVSTVPEPTTMLLLGSGLIGLAGYGRKKLFKK